MLEDLVHFKDIVKRLEKREEMRKVVELKKKKLDRMTSRAGGDEGKLQELEREWYNSNKEFEQVRTHQAPSLSIENFVSKSLPRSTTAASQSSRL